jgi:undecaprenyl-phosphate 4-deoxy-4-formamido-L-arabinose transferase
VARLLEVMPNVAADYEVILVVDGSPDNTWPVAHSLAMRHNPVRAIHLTRNYSQHNALVAGIRSARYDITVTMDDDLQHPPEEVPRLLATLADDVDLVYGVAREEEHNFARNITSRMVKVGMSSVLGVKDAKHLSAFRAFRTFLRDGFDTLRGPHVSVDVALSWSTTRTTVVTVRMDERSDGRSGYTFRTLVRHALNMVLGYSVAPLRLVTYLGLAIGTGGLLIVVRLLWLYYQGETVVAGFTTLACLIALFSSAQLVATGVLGEYIGRIHSHGIGRPTYVIRDRTEGESSNEFGAVIGPEPLAEPVRPRQGGDTHQRNRDVTSR